MSSYRRWYVPGGMYFFTLVTYNRRPIFSSGYGRRLLRTAIEEVRSKHPFDIVATVLLPDHWHLIMKLPKGNTTYSVRLKQIKARFTTLWLEEGLPEVIVTPSQLERGERGLWQPRFWEHTIRDEDDLERCVDYIHWNPRKHSLVARVADWKWSSFHRFVDSGDYDIKVQQQMMCAC